MSPVMNRLSSLVAVAFILPAIAASQASAKTVDKTQSPYFVVKSDDPSVDALPLKETRADVQISGVIARVIVTQTYANDGKNPLEAIYVFPGSTRSAVFGMTMKIGDRTIVAKINKKEEARKIYERAKAAGKSASLLEQQRPNVFQMNVANIMPGDVIQVEMQYTELLVPEDGTYEFVYPAVVGPRFTGEASEGDAKKNKWTATPHTKSGAPATYAWGLDVNIDGGVAIADVASPSHKVKEVRDGNASSIRLAKGEQGGDRDFVLRYRLTGESIQAGMLLFPGEKENFFLTMVQPPKRVEPREIPRREYVFIMDVSGSMYGFPLNTSKKLMQRLSKGLKKTDLFNMLFFSGRAALLSDRSLPATPRNINKAITQFNQMRGGGGTRLLSALKKAMALPTTDDVARTFVIVTDGYISVEPDVFEYIRANLGKANLFAFGIGSSVNRHLIEGMSRVGMGESFIALNGSEATKVAKRFKKYIETPALTNIKVAFEGFEAYDVEPKSVPDLFAQRPVVVFGKYRGKPKGKIRITGTTGLGSFQQIVRPNDYVADKSNNALRYLWARHRIAALADLNKLRPDDKRVQQVTNLGLEYSLMTAYTSFVAVDSEVRNKGGESSTVKQPLPLPYGVSDLAVAGSLRAPRARSLHFSGQGVGGGGSSKGSLHGVGSGTSGGYGYGAKRKVYRKSTKLGVATAEASPARPVLTKIADEDDESFAPGDGKLVKEEKAKKAPSLRLNPMVVSAKGSLTVAEVAKTLRKRLSLCVRNLRAGLRGVVWFEATIGADGKITLLTRQKSSLSAPEIVKCLESQLKKMRFKKGAGKTSIRFGIRIY